MNVSDNKKEGITNEMVFVQILERPARKLVFKPGVKTDRYFGFESTIPDYPLMVPMLPSSLKNRP